MSVRLLGSVVVLLAAVAACATAEGTEPAPPVPMPGTEARELSVPFDRYNFSPADIMILEAAEDLLIRDCMRRRGMEWEVLPPAVADDVEPPNRRRYGVVEAEVADLYGFRVPPDRPSVARRFAAREARTRRLPTAAREAAYGKTGSCLGEARDHLERGTPQVDEALFNRLITETFERSQQDPAVERVFQAWSACMREHGLRYADPLAAVADERWTGDGAPTREEIRAAQVDVRCKAETALISVWSAVEKRIQDGTVRAHAAEFQALRTAKDQQLAAARRVLSAQD